MFEYTANLDEGFSKFANNVRAFCSEAAISAPRGELTETAILRLQDYPSSQRELASIFEENVNLQNEVMKFKHIIAALRARHTIEKLSKFVPKIRTYNDKTRDYLTSTTKEWKDVWNTSGVTQKTNEGSLFHALRKQEDKWGLEYYLDEGMDLFGDMSSEIHNFLTAMKVLMIISTQFKGIS